MKLKPQEIKIAAVEVFTRLRANRKKIDKENSEKVKKAWEEEKPRARQLLNNSFSYLTNSETEGILEGIVKLSFQSSQTLLPTPNYVSLETLAHEVGYQNLVTDSSVEQIIENLVIKYS
jgi:hypothetical protein